MRVWGSPNSLRWPCLGSKKMILDEKFSTEFNVYWSKTCIPIFYLVGIEKDKLKSSTKIPLQPPGILPCLVDSNHKRSESRFIFLRFLWWFCSWIYGMVTEIVQRWFFPLKGSDECAGTHRLLFRCPPVGLPWMFFPGCVFFVCGLLNNIWGVSKNRGTPKWMVYNGKPY